VGNVISNSAVPGYLTVVPWAMSSALGSNVLKKSIEGTAEP